MQFFGFLVKIMAVALALSNGGAAAGAPLAERGAPENYIVLFRDAAKTPENVYNDVLQHLKDLGAQVNHEYKSIVKGFSISLDSDYVPKLLDLSNPEYPFIVESDKGVHVSE